MEKPLNKEELLFKSEETFIKLLDLIDASSEENKIYSKSELDNRDKTFADVICHLHERH